MAKESNKETTKFERIEPVGKRVVIRKDEDRKQTKGGIQLPDNLEIPTITGRIVAISAEVENDENLPLRQYDKILFNPKHAIPVELEPGNQLLRRGRRGRRGCFSSRLIFSGHFLQGNCKFNQRTKHLRTYVAARRVDWRVVCKEIRPGNRFKERRGRSWFDNVLRFSLPLAPWDIPDAET